MRPDLVLGIDCGTSSCKALVWDRDGNAVSEGRADIAMSMPRPAWHEQSAEDWWRAAEASIRQAVESIEGGRIAALCIAHQRESFVAVDEAGNPLREAILWMDERARPLLGELSKAFGEESFREITGKTLSGNLSVGKLEWLRREEPELIHKAYKILDAQAFLVQKLSGVYRTSWASADPTGLFDMRMNIWSEEILSKVGLRPNQMPEALPPGAILARVTPEAALECGLQAGIPIVSGLGDGQAAGLGTNISRSGDCYLSLGTSIVSGSFSSAYVTSAAFRAMYGGFPDSYVLETVLLGGGYTVQWFLDAFAPGEAQAEGLIEGKAAALPPGAQGLMLVPYWNSAMNPYWDAQASGITIGWTGIHRPEHLYRAILEGAAFELRLHASGVEKALGRPIDRYIAAGGGAKSSLWCQIIADITGTSVYRARSNEAAALGAGILASLAAGLHPSAAQAAKAMVHVEPMGFSPDASRRPRYDRLYDEVYVRLFPALRPYIDRLTEIASMDGIIPSRGL
jgi:sugar (pentulose or hexulose) kinase